MLLLLPVCRSYHSAIATILKWTNHDIFLTVHNGLEQHILSLLSCDFPNRRIPAIYILSAHCTPGLTVDDKNNSLMVLHLCVNNNCPEMPL